MLWTEQRVAVSIGIGINDLSPRLTVLFCRHERSRNVCGRSMQDTDFADDAEYIRVPPKGRQWGSTTVKAEVLSS